MRHIALPVSVAVLLAVACGDTGGDTAATVTEPQVPISEVTTPQTSAADTEEAVSTASTLVETDTVVVGDRVIELESVGCVGARETAPPRLYAFGTDQDGVHYGVRVEDYVVGVAALADDGLEAVSRFAPAWEGAAVQGAGEFRVNGGLAEPLTGSLQAACPVTGLESGWAVDEAGFEMPLPAGIVCVDAGATFSFAAGQVLYGLHTSEPELVTHLVDRHPGAFEPAALAEFVEGPGVEAVVELADLAGFGEGGLLAGYEAALLLPGQPSPIFTTLVPAEQFSMTADIDYADALRANPRAQTQIDEYIERYGEAATIDLEVTCAVSLEGPPGATVGDVAPNELP